MLICAQRIVYFSIVDDRVFLYLAKLTYLSQADLIVSATAIE
jgi:hypothetical protein